MPEINKKSAPQREVLAIVKTGSYGAVQYVHRLGCGHTEKRKRKAAAQYIACTLCAVAIEAKNLLGTLAAKEKRYGQAVLDSQKVDDENDFAGGVDSGETELNAAKLTADLASVFQVPNEMISITYGDDDIGLLVVVGATIWLDLEVMKKLLGRHRNLVHEDEHRKRRALGN